MTLFPELHDIQAAVCSKPGCADIAMPHIALLWFRNLNSLETGRVSGSFKRKGCPADLGEGHSFDSFACMRPLQAHNNSLEEI